MHWSTRTLAEHLGVGATTIRRVWQSNGLKPHLSRSFKLSRDPRFEDKLTDVVGRYMNPPEGKPRSCSLACGPPDARQREAIKASADTPPGFRTTGRARLLPHPFQHLPRFCRQRVRGPRHQPDIRFLRKGTLPCIACHALHACFVGARRSSQFVYWR
jgi:hypothetical protein